MGNFLVGSFYTLNTPYEKIISELLIPSLKKLDLEYTIVGIENHRDWYVNVAEKPAVIRRIFEEMKDKKDIVFLDADATIEQYPKIFESIPQEYDLALHYLDWSTWYRNGSDRKELLSGTLFLRYNDRVMSLLSQWHERAIKTRLWEQQVLEELLKERTDIKVFELPIEYCYIKTLPDGRKPFIEVNPVVVHHQVSRFMRKIIK